MQQRKLGQTEIKVSVIGLGTMTIGEQNSEADGHRQLDYALAHGVNFIDTAEFYSIPPRAETYGSTETVIGNWLRKTCKRDRIVLATKMAGPGPDWIPHIRGGKTRFNRKHIEKALDGSLKRLQTDYVDLYQLHWPERSNNRFGQLGYVHTNERNLTPILETLEALAEQAQAGKIRHIGLSNETPWGTMKFLELADRYGLPRVVTIQNPYSLLNRSYEIGMAEISHREQAGLLAYSPLGFGVLSGKYLGGKKPKGARITLFPHYDRYTNGPSKAATKRYVQLARDHGLDPAQMALAFVTGRPFVTSTLIGATTLEQLKSNIDSARVKLSDELLAQVDAIHAAQPNPSP